MASLQIHFPTCSCFQSWRYFFCLLICLFFKVYIDISSWERNNHRRNIPASELACHSERTGGKDYSSLQHVYWEPEMSCSNGYFFSASLGSDNLTSRGLELLVADAHPCCSVAAAETLIYLYLLPEDRYLLGWPEAGKDTSPPTPPCPDFAQWAGQSGMRIGNIKYGSDSVNIPWEFNDLESCKKPQCSYSKHLHTYVWICNG